MFGRVSGKAPPSPSAGTFEKRLMQAGVRGIRQISAAPTNAPRTGLPRTERIDARLF